MRNSKHKYYDVPYKFHDLKFNTNNLLINNKKSIRFVWYLMLFLIFLIIVSGLAIVNIRYANDGKYNFHDLFYIFSTNNVLGNNTQQLTNITTSANQTFGQFSFTDLVPIRKAFWISIATILAGIGLTIAGAIAQGLTKNPLSDPTTLGTSEAVIFGIILMNVLVGSFIGANIFQYVYLGFAFLGGFLAIMFILLILKYASQQSDYLKITLIGLAISIFFKTMSFLLRTNSASATKTSYAIAIGGAENIYGLYPSQETILLIGIIIISIVFFLAMLFSKNLTILELGDDKARSLGVNTKWIKLIGLFILLAVIPIAISLVGNVAFVGLFTPHIIRMIFKTRDYRIIIPLGGLLGAGIMSFGLTLNTFFHTIPSSIYMVFIGAPMLIYLGWKQKKVKV